ncbi:hypothetical protein ENBRE01_1656 [Enteropsectra breve]|nr:hypothetical protein ENBRE01_1656 [Enteropsectra breve]
MRIFHILITAVSCISYTILPSDMLLVDKKDLKDKLINTLNCTLCNMNIDSSTNAENYDANKSSFKNYCYNLFRCSYCSHIFHARCFVCYRPDKHIACPNPYCFTVYSQSEMERFFGQLLLSYAYNDVPAKEFKNLYDEYKTRLIKLLNIKAKPPIPEPLTFAHLEMSQIQFVHQDKITKIIEEIFINILLNGRIAHALMDPQIWDKLSVYLIREIGYTDNGHKYLTKMLQGNANKRYIRNFTEDSKPILTPRDYLDTILYLARVMRDKDVNYYMDVYLNEVENALYPEFSKICALYFFSYLFQMPDAFLKIEYSLLYYIRAVQNSDGSINDRYTIKIEKFREHFQDTLVSASEAIFRKLYTDYIDSPQKQGLLAIKLCTNTEFKHNYLVKMLVRLVLRTGYQPILYSAPDREFVFRVLLFCSKNIECKLYPGEICGVLKLFKMNNENFTPDQKEQSVSIIKGLLMTPIPSESIKLFVDTLINNYSSYLGQIYAKYIHYDSLKAICGGYLQKNFKNEDSAREFKKFVLERRDNIKR